MRQVRVLAALLAAACLLPLCACDQGAQTTPNETDAAQVEVLDRTADEVETEEEAQPEPQEDEKVEKDDPEPEEPTFDATAPVATETSDTGVSVTAPEGFLDTPEFQAVEEEISALTQSGYHVGVVMMDLETGNSITFNEDERLYPASSIKAPYCAMVCETNGGPGSMSATMERCLVDSSNEDYEVLINAYGMPAFGAWLEEHGATEAAYDGSIWWYPEISAGELAAAWQEIYRYGTSGEAGGSELAGYLARTNHSPIGQALRESCEVWSKPGWFSNNGELVATNDAGIVFSDSGPYVMVIMTTMSANLDGLLPLVEALDAAHATVCGA